MTPLNTRTYNAVFRGDVLLATGVVVRGFIKDLDPRQLANEMLVAVLGSSLGVNVPKGVLVAVDATVSNAFRHIPHQNGSDYIAFCSVDAGGSTIAQIISAEASLATLSALKVSPGLGWMYGFDTWVANVDRHAGNIVLSGDGSAYLIDHGHCFGGPTWDASRLNASSPYSNRLREWLTPQLSAEERGKAMADISRLLLRMAGTDVQQAVDDALVEQLCGARDSDAVMSFLEARVEHVSGMSATALDVLV